MARQSFIWTALPNGYTDDGLSLRLTALLSPRLDPEAKPQRLQSFFPDWKDWPATLRQASIHVRYSGTTVSIPVTQTAGATRIDNRLGLSDSAIWLSLFNKNLFVRPFDFLDLSTQRVLSYDYAALCAAVASLYAELAATAGDDLPTISELLSTPLWRGLPSIVKELDEASFDDETGLRDPRRMFDLASERVANLHSHLRRFQLFHAPPAKPKPRSQVRTDDARISATWLEYERMPRPGKAEQLKKLDFHQYIASMASYPTLLRRLGLAIDLVLPGGSLPAANDAPLTVDVAFPAGALAIPKSGDANPQTRTLLSADRFHAVSRTTAPIRVLNGLLALDPESFTFMQLDADGAWHKLLNFARTLYRKPEQEHRRDSVSRKEERVGAPSLRSAGLILVHRQRGEDLGTRFSENKAGNAAIEAQFGGSAAPVSLCAEDLTRGYRVDILDSFTGRWRSLFRRASRYEFDGGALVVTVPDEEGTLQLAATKSSDPTYQPNALYLHEAMMSWPGWSLAAPPPGRAILPDDSVDTSTPETEQELPPGVDFRSSFKPTQGSLPRLRFGRTYSVRARAVDLAGNSLTPRESDFGWESTAAPSCDYLRLEPLESPVIALLSRAGSIETPGAGESVSRMAIRTFNATPADNTVPTSQSAHRAVAPPRVSVREAEHHGMLDVGGAVAGFLFNMLANEKDVDPRDSAAAIREVKMQLQGPLEYAATDTYLAAYESGRSLTYLPDPLATEVAARVFDHPSIADSEIITIPLYPDGRQWPDAAPFTIVLTDDPDEKPHFEAATRQLCVPLPKAGTASVRLSMRLSPRTLEQMAVFRWIPAALRAASTPRALEGQHWMLTPWRVVELIHAVQRPLVTPEIDSIGIANRALSATSARPVMQVTCSIASTDRLDLHAEWHEPVDDPALPESQLGPANRQRRDLAFQVKVTQARQYAQRVLGDSGGGYPDHTVSGTDSIGINAVATNPGMPATVQAKAHEFHDTRYRRIEYWFDATTRFREFLPASLLTRLEAGATVAIEDHIKVSGKRAVAWVPSSASPPAAKVLYVVPTFGWVREVDESRRALRYRQGGGLRVYLDRSWNDSGYGEMLAVVLPPAGFSDDPDTKPQGRPYKDYVTQWGNDPVWDSSFVAGVAPRRADFPRARGAPDASGAWLPPGAPASEADQKPGVFVATNLQVPRSTGQSAPVEIAAHDVFFDASRRLWYCDIEVQTGATYYPFIRLALARFQPTSCPGAHLSHVVLTDVMSLSADRWFNVTPTAEADRLRVVVSGIRAFESSGHHEAAHAPSVSLTPLGGPVETLEPAQLARSTTIEVWLEELDERYGEDFGWVLVSSAAISGGDPWDAAPDQNAALAKAIGPAVLSQVSVTERAARMSLAAARALEPQVSASELGGLVTSWQVLWDGEVRLPPPSGRRRRLVVAEFEEYLVDDSRPYDAIPTRKGRRMVFVEHLELQS